MEVLKKVQKALLQARADFDCAPRLAGVDCHAEQAALDEAQECVDRAKATLRVACKAVDVAAQLVKRAKAATLPNKPGEHVATPLLDHNKGRPLHPLLEDLIKATVASDAAERAFAEAWTGTPDGGNWGQEEDEKITAFAKAHPNTSFGRAWVAQEGASAVAKAASLAAYDAGLPRTKLDRYAFEAALEAAIRASRDI